MSRYAPEGGVSRRAAALGAALCLVLALHAFGVRADEESWNEKLPAAKGKSGSGGGKSEPKPKPPPASPAPPAPAPSPAPTPDFAKELEAAKKLMKDTPEGAAIVKFLEDKKIPIEYDGSDGSFWNGTKIVLRFNTAEALALELVHEANHAKQSKEGKTADINKDSREDYVKKMLAEEVQGTVNSIELKLALVKKGKKISATYPLEAQYVAAYKKAVAALKKSNPGATEAELDAAGRKAGSDAVKKGFDTGKVVTSTSNQKYSDYYGKEWDKKHPKTP